jgi:hypothetical protein
MSELVDSASNAMEGLKVTEDLPMYQDSDTGSMIGSSVSKSSKTKIEIDAAMYTQAMDVINKLLEKVY